MSYRNLLIADQGAVRRIIINRPDKLNALNFDTIGELRQAFAEAEAATGVRVIVLTGAGSKAFVAGADIAEMNGLSPIQGRDFSRHGQKLMQQIEECGKPVIAMLNGFALGGGMELAMACHLRIASNTAKLGQPEINLGLIPGFGGTQRLLRLAGRGPALELCLLGQPIDATRALALNLVTRVVPADQLEAETDRLAEQLAAAAPQALRAMIGAIVQAGEAPLSAALDYESQAFAVTFSTDDMKEGTSAFMDRRKPQFRGH
jgi:enoyl-CoA hydratase